MWNLVLGVSKRKQCVDFSVKSVQEETMYGI